ncbi:MAG: RNA methyltransferase [bacterium]|nr:RNA methyltransferase [bacterium]
MVTNENLELLNNLHVVMVEPKNPGNIGASVRAMKNMGVSRLRLVNPVEGYKDSLEQRKMGYRAQEITQASKEYAGLEDAVSDMSVVFLATTKKGKWKRDFLLPHQAGEIVAQRVHKEKIAIVFGREESGVNIDESQMADYFIYIPMAGSYPSLNLAQAVLVVLYEIFKNVGQIAPLPLPANAKKNAFERLYENIWLLMKGLKIKEPEKGLFHRSLKRALNRTRWTRADIAVFDRLCKQVRWFVNNNTKDDFIDEYDPRTKKELDT